MIYDDYLSDMKVFTEKLSKGLYRRRKKQIEIDDDDDDDD